MADQKKLPPNSKPKIMSLSDLNKNNHEDCDSDEEKQTYYTGGEKSGTAVQGRPKAKSGPKNLLEGIFAKASAQQASGQSDANTDIVTIHLIFWRDGLTVGDGPLRPYSDPATIRFLDLIDKEIIPDELNIDPNAAVDFKMTQLPDLALDKNKQREVLQGDQGQTAKKNPFSGQAETLGDVNNDVVKVNNDVTIADTITTTRIQVVLSTGAKKVITVNPRILIDELYKIIQHETGVAQFSLITGTPPMVVPQDLKAALYQVGLMNCSVIMK